MNCPQCNTTYFDNAPACPQCGAANPARQASPAANAPQPAPLMPPPPQPGMAPPFAAPRTPAYAAPQQTAPNSGLAIASLVLGIAGLVSCGLTAVIGLILGIVAAAKTPRGQRTNGMAIAGIVVSAVFTVFILPAIVASVLFPVFAKAREKARSTTCVSNQRQIITAYVMYAQDHEGKLPSDSEVWPGVNTEGVTELMTHCPASTGNSYGYNAVCGQKALSTFNNPNHLIVFADATSPSITDVDSIDYRHNHSSVVAYLDGHAKVVSSVMAEELRP